MNYQRDTVSDLELRRAKFEIRRAEVFAKNEATISRREKNAEIRFNAECLMKTIDTFVQDKDEREWTLSQQKKIMEKYQQTYMGPQSTPTYRGGFPEVHNFTSAMVPFPTTCPGNFHQGHPPSAFENYQRPLNTSGG